MLRVWYAEFWSSFQLWYFSERTSVVFLICGSYVSGKACSLTNTTETIVCIFAEWDWHEARRRRNKGKFSWLAVYHNEQCIIRSVGKIRHLFFLFSILRINELSVQFSSTELWLCEGSLSLSPSLSPSTPPLSLSFSLSPSLFLPLSHSLSPSQSNALETLCLLQSYAKRDAIDKRVMEGRYAVSLRFTNL